MFCFLQHEQVSRDMFDYMIKQNDSLANELNETFKLGNPDTWDNFEKSLEAKEDKAVAKRIYKKPDRWKGYMHLNNFNNI